MHIHALVHPLLIAAASDTAATAAAAAAAVEGQVWERAGGHKDACFRTLRHCRSPASDADAAY